MTAYSAYSDQELVVLLQEGNHHAYSVIYNRYKFLLYAHAYRKLADREEARDVVQEVFVSLWNKHEVIDPGLNLSGYLYTVLRNGIMNLFARREVQSKYHLSLKQHYLNEYVPADDKIRTGQLKETIDREINLLPEKMRMVFVLSRKQHLSRKLIAAQLGISEKTVDRQIANALKILKTRLSLIGYLIVLLNLSR